MNIRDYFVSFLLFILTLNAIYCYYFLTLVLDAHINVNVNVNPEYNYTNIKL